MHNPAQTIAEAGLGFAFVSVSAVESVMGRVMKKTWQKPKLTILVRSRPQEAILQICKGYQVGTIPMSGYDGCGAGTEPVCVTCEVYSGS